MARPRSLYRVHVPGVICRTDAAMLERYAFESYRAVVTRSGVYVYGRAQAHGVRRALRRAWRARTGKPGPLYAVEVVPTEALAAFAGAVRSGILRARMADRGRP